jgi:hypothetical protein
MLPFDMIRLSHQGFAPRHQRFGPRHLPSCNDKVGSLGPFFSLPSSASLLTHSGLGPLLLQPPCWSHRNHHKPFSLIHLRTSPITPRGPRGIPNLPQVHTLRTHTDARNPIIFLGLCNGSLDTEFPLAADFAASLVYPEASRSATIPFRITSFAHPRHLTPIESHSCKNRGRGVGPAPIQHIVFFSSQITGHGSQYTGHESRITSHESRVTNHKSQITSRSPRGSWPGALPAQRESRASAAA